jgi:hypothetical protein
VSLRRSQSESRMPEIGTSGLMSGDGKRGGGNVSTRAHPRLYPAAGLPPGVTYGNAPGATGFHHVQSGEDGGSTGQIGNLPSADAQRVFAPTRNALSETLRLRTGQALIVVDSQGRARVTGFFH